MEDVRDEAVEVGMFRLQMQGYHHSRRLWGTGLHNHFLDMMFDCLLVEEVEAAVIHRQSLMGRLGFPCLQCSLIQMALALLAIHTKHREERYYSESVECCQRSAKHTDSPVWAAAAEDLSHCCWIVRADCHLQAFDAVRSGI